MLLRQIYVQFIFLISVICIVNVLCCSAWRIAGVDAVKLYAVSTNFTEARSVHVPGIYTRVNAGLPSG